MTEADVDRVCDALGELLTTAGLVTDGSPSTSPSSFPVYNEEAVLPALFARLYPGARRARARPTRSSSSTTAARDRSAADAARAVPGARPT